MLETQHMIFKYNKVNTLARNDKVQPNFTIYSMKGNCRIPSRNFAP